MFVRTVVCDIYSYVQVPVAALLSSTSFCPVSSTCFAGATRIKLFDWFPVLPVPYVLNGLIGLLFIQ